MDRLVSLEQRRIQLAVEPAFRLGCATIDPLSHECRVGGVATRLQPQTLKVLVALHDKVGSVVTRDELVDRCWNGRIVGDDVINRCISLLRHLAAQAGGFGIETVPRTGYRLIEEDTASPARPTRKMPPVWIAAVAVAILVAAAAGGLWLDRSPGSQGKPPTPSISVVSFAVQGHDPLVTQLAAAAPGSLSHLLSESGFAIVREPTAQASVDPQTDYIFSGSFRRTGPTVEASVQMVSKRDGTIAFSHDFSAPLDRAPDLPDRIAAAAAAELAWTGAEMVLDPREHIDPQVESELMSAIVLTIERRDGLRAYQLSRHAAAMAPNSAIAQLSLAMQTGFSISLLPEEERPLALAVGRRAAARARALAPEFGDVYLTGCLLRSPVRLAECEALTQRALAVDSSSSFVPGLLSELYHEVGRVSESAELADQSLANDPYKPAKLARMIRMDEVTGDSAGAERLYRNAVRLWPEDPRMSAARVSGTAERGDYAALNALAKRLPNESVLSDPALVQLLAARQAHDLPATRRACAGSQLQQLTLALCMTALADLGDATRSFQIAAALYPIAQAGAGDEDRIWLAHPDGFGTAILSAPAARAMRSDARFLPLAGKLGLLAYWRARGLPDFCTKTHEPVCDQIRGARI